jgi:hypothetical protein
MGGARDNNARDGKCVHSLGQKKLKVTDHLKDLGVDWRVWFLNKTGGMGGIHQAFF